MLTELQSKEGSAITRPPVFPTSGPIDSPDYQNGDETAQEQTTAHTASIQPYFKTERDASKETPIADQPDRGHLVSKEDYSVFTIWQKRWIVLAGSYAAFFSPMTGSIYFPAIDKIAEELGVSVSDISLTVTTYLVIQGLAPMMVAGFSDKAGRRPAYVLCFTIYMIANLALALQNNYIALLLLRMLQSAGSSGTVALANGLVGDVITSSERGQYIAYTSLGSILGPTLAPVIGGLISQYLDWHWLFWFLLILAGVSVVPFFIFLPETCRNIVGDGSYPPPLTSWNLSDHIRHRRRREQGIEPNPEKLAELRKNHKLSVPNPIATLTVLADFEAATVLIATGLLFSCFYAVSTGAASVLSSRYGYNELEIGLIFITIGGGSLISALTTGKLIDWNYARYAKKLGYPLTKNRETDLSEFPIERARLEIGLPLLLFSAATVMAYGWMMTTDVSIAGPCVMLFLMGYSLIAGFQVLNVLMVDIYPRKPAAAAAAGNAVRCLLGAGASAAIIPMSEAMGNGWAYTTMALLFVAASSGLVATMRYGVKWRQAKKEKMERKARRKASVAKA